MRFLGIKIKLLLVCLITLLGSAFGSETSKDSTQTTKQYKNTIRYNFSSSAFFANTKATFGYERVVSPHQSFSINFGLNAFPKLININLDSFSIEKDSKGSGFILAGDYRFYLKKENKHLAPRGVYIGPYCYYTLMKRDNKASLNFTSGNSLDFEIKNRLDVLVAGFQLGYQFLLFKDRIALDLILFGPGMGFYRYQGKLSNAITNEEGEALLSNIKEYLVDNYPAAQFLVDKSTFTKKGNAFTSDFGYRMVFQVGYRF